jgi:hypothetical protein
MRILKNIVWNFAARHRLVYDAKIHGLPFVPDQPKKEKAVIKKNTTAESLNYRTAHELPSRNIIEDGNEVTLFIKEDEVSKMISGRVKHLTDYDRHYILERFKYKDYAKVDWLKFEAVKRRWAIGKSNLDIEKLNVGIKISSIKNATRGFVLALEHEQSDGRGER